MKNQPLVVVVGGGPAGFAAAIAAARQGCRTCLLERYDILGGMATVGLVNNFCNAHFDGERFIIGGIFAEIRQKLIDRNALFVTGGLEPFNHNDYAELLLQTCKEAGVDVRFGESVKDIDTTGYQSTLYLSSGGVLEADFVVDATGDASMLAAAGVPYAMGRAGDHAVMPLTFCYVLGPFDPLRLAEGVPGAFIEDKKTGRSFAYLGGQPKLMEWVRTAKEKGEITIPRERIAVAYEIPGEGHYLAVNFGRVTVKDPTDPPQLAQADELGRAQAREGEAFFRKYVPGFENASIVEYARQIGVRESRQIEGQYRLTGEDVIACRQFPDVIAQCCYSIDIHDPKSSGTTLIALRPGTHYDIPLRCLIPKEEASRMVAVGRCISATHEAMSSFRVSPSAMAIGEAGGVLAALAATNKIAGADVPYEDVRRVLLENGGILD